MRNSSSWTELIRKVESAVATSRAIVATEKIRYQAILNGVLGDRLAEYNNSLATRMGFFVDNTPLPLTKSSLKKLKTKSRKICILAHGSCTTEQDWSFQDNPSEDYGSFLYADLGYVPFYLRYNSGLHISTNGKLLSSLLEKLVRTYPHGIDELVLLGHSMGGLIFRSACYYGEQENRAWIHLVKKVFYLGSPHCGTHFEKFGKLTTTILQAIPTIPTYVIATLIELRSAGIKDLRHGYLTHEDWQVKHADDLLYIHQHKTPLLSSAEHYQICSTLSKSSDSKIARLFGDGLVHPGSGTGSGLLSTSRIPFRPEHCKVFSGMSHYNLLKSKKVYAQIRAWVR